MEQTSPIQALLQQRTLLQIEYYTEKEAFRKQTEQMGMQRKVKRGDAWFPLRIGKSFYNSLNQNAIEVFRTEDQDIEHNFEFGRPVMFFKAGENKSAQTDGKTEKKMLKYFSFTGTVSYVDGDRMVITVPDSAPLLELQQADVPVGVQLSFDETSYKMMFDALDRTMKAKNNRLAYLRDLFYSHRKAERYSFEPMRFPWLNPTQEQAVNEVLWAKDVAIVHGPPGTGKTSCALRYMVEEALTDPNASLLLLSYTNRAVDEICNMLVGSGIAEKTPFIRIGNELSCDKRFVPYLLKYSLADYPKLTDIQKKISQTRIFVGTTTAINSRLHLFNLKHFTLAIIDEASQILEPDLIGILSARHNRDNAIDKFILIGDYKQLPAVVQQSEQDSGIPTINDSQKGGIIDMSILQDICLTNCRNSLFERLIHWEDHEERSEFIGILRRQGRMHPEIAEFPNRMFYRREKLEPVPCPHQLETELSYTLPSEDALDDLLKEHRMIFLPSKFCKEPNVSDKINANEAAIVVDLLRRIHRFYGERFDAKKTVGVIVPYRNQIAMVRKGIEKLGIPELEKISIDTVERYQGSQRDVIIYSFTIQNIWQLDFLAGNSFVEDGAIIDRKLNVAITRARKQMIMTGNPEILRNNQIFSELMNYVKEKGGYF